MATSPDQPTDDLRPEYDFRSMRGVVRGKYASRPKPTVLSVVLEPDVAVAFPTAEAVNAALREYLRTHPTPDPAATDSGA